MISTSRAKRRKVADFRRFLPANGAGCRCRRIRAVRRRTLARSLIVRYRTAAGGLSVTQKRFGRCIIIDDDPDILLVRAAAAARPVRARSPTFQDPAEALAAMEQRAARRHPARRQFRPRRDQRRRGLPLARRDLEARPAGGGGDDHRPCRDQRRGRGDEARRHRFRLQALVERAAARHRPHRRGAAHLARGGR